MIMRLVCCAAVVSLTGARMIHADVLLPFATTSCTINGISTPCQMSYVLPEERGAWVSGDRLPFTTAKVDASAWTDLAAGVTSVFASITVQYWLYTPGPVRPGFIDCSSYGGGETSGPGYWMAGAGVLGVDCGTMGQTPFTLGIPFEVGLFALVAATLNSDARYDQSAGAGAAVTSITVTDASGAPVEVLGPFSSPTEIVPEPSHLGFGALGLLGAAMLLGKRRRV